jgi:hypothetical protein
VGVTSQPRMLAPPKHLILPSLLSGVRVALHSTLYLLIITFNTLLASLFDMLNMKYNSFKAYEHSNFGPFECKEKSHILASTLCYVNIGSPIFCDVI